MNKKIKLMGYINKGYEGQGIEIECDIRNGFPGFDIVGLPDNAIKESRERVKTALRNCGFKLPQNRILVSLSPASQPKSGSLLDLGIALSILFSMNQGTTSTNEEIIKIMVAGELKLNGDIVQTAESIGAIECAHKHGCRICIIPFPTEETDFAIHATDLTQAFLTCGEMIHTGNIVSPITKRSTKNVIFEDVIGLTSEKETLCMAVSGFHSLLLFGPPGVGKTMLSKKLLFLMPEKSQTEKEEIRRIYSCANQTDNISFPPQRILPHDLSAVQFTGGSSSKSPGEGALAHNGILVLDEADKYSPKLLQAIQTTYDCGITQSSKSGNTITYPANFMLVANLNPCSCGGLGNPLQVCTCTSQKLDSHWKKLGWQFIDRFDIRLPIKAQNIFLETESKPDTYYIDKIATAVDRQKQRFKEIENVNFNGQIHLNSDSLSVLKNETDLVLKTVDANNLNPRSVFSIISVSRTIADYEDRNEICTEDINKALEFRSYCHGDYYWRQIN